MYLQDNAESARTKSRKGFIVGMKRIGLASVALAAVLFASGAQLQAGITNGSFESGLTGWTPLVTPGGDATVTVVTSVPAPPQTYNPTDGSHFAYLVASGDGSGTQSLLSQQFTAIAGDVLKLDVFFVVSDAAVPPNPALVGFGKVNLIDLTVPQTTLLSSQLTAGFTNWLSVSSAALIAGHNYVIEALANRGTSAEPGNTSALGLDNVRIVNDTPPPSGVPEPMSLVIWGIGGVVMMVSAARRRQQNAV